MPTRLGYTARNERPAPYICGGCGHVALDLGARGVWIPPTRTSGVEYSLCETCAAGMKADPGKMHALVSARMLNAWERAI
jgi:hypothetical protein